MHELRVNFEQESGVRSVELIEPHVYTPETVYYLVISTPHLMEIVVTGAFCPLDTIIPQICMHFGDDYKLGTLIKSLSRDNI